MYWTSLLPVTIFMLANTLGVSQSAATGRQRLLSSESDAIGGGSRPLQQEQRDDDTDLPLRPAGFSSSAASSIESTVPEWINPRPDKDNAVDENDDNGNEDEEWGDMPLSPGGNLFGPRDPTLLQQPPSLHNTNNNNNHLMLLTPADLLALRHYFNGGSSMGGGLMKRGDKLKRIYLATKLREQPALPSASSTRTLQSNYRLPAERNIIRGNFDKRSPRCIANCMRQGLVHPIQCHSLCRKR